MHKAAKAVIIMYLLLSIKNMFSNYNVYSQQPTCLMEFECNFHFMPLYIFKLVTSEFSRVSGFSRHLIFGISWHRICGLTEAMVDKTLLAFGLCCHKNSAFFNNI